MNILSVNSVPSMTSLQKPPAEFAGRQVVIATMHGKEQAIAPLLQSNLGISTHVPSDFNTDRFGTFTRDVKRPAEQLATARIKAQAALELTGGDLAIASEGSFGTHPDIPFVPCDRELVLLLDQKHDLEIVGQAISTQTNYRSQTIRSVEEALTSATEVGFPEHGLVVMPTAEGGSPAEIAKGLKSKDALVTVIDNTLASSITGTAHIETDMRAHVNPSRMGVIAEATEHLIQTIAQRCPACNCPGFAIAKRNPGLPCAWCRTPTLLTLSVTYRCQRCQCDQVKMYPDGQQTADPGNCPYCNP